MNGISAGIQPSPAQAQNIARKNGGGIPSASRPVHPVVAVWARTGWELDTLVSALMTALPDHAASPPDDPPAGRAAHGICPVSAREQFTGAVDRIFDTAESVCIASVARTVLRAVRRWSLCSPRCMELDFLLNSLPGEMPDYIALTN